jgi:BirA family biotin operon repressor/biotin-[acetyl-CoA-carboxylase] ligase|tara:strand:+ start:2511 stop:3284 length:774 start_codon:yes stop_codon:yes gene_type:complete
MIFTQLIQTNLRTRELGKRVEYYNRLDSTNEEAWELIEEEQENQHGTIVITENQIKGKGRKEDPWSMVAGKGLAMSIILDKKYPANHSSFISLATGVSVVESLKKRGVECSLKWPNDIYSQDKKLGGILCESKIKKNEIDKIVVGVGINVNETIEEHPHGLQATLTTMFSITNHPHQRELIVAEFINSFERLLVTINDDPTSLIDHWLSHCSHLNKSVSFSNNGKINKGIFIGLDEKGYAQIEINGKVQTLNSINLI